MPADPATLFEVSWEICHKVGGVHAVIASKAKTLVARLRDSYVAVGPWLLSEGNAEKVLDVDPAFDAFAEGCRAAGVPVRVGRWRVPGAPRTILVEFSTLYGRRDEILGALWDRHAVDSLSGGWDYVEPVLFGHAAGVVVERWFREFGRGPAVAQFHEWMAGAGLLHLRKAAPEIGAVFTAHATVLGRSLAATGVAPLDAPAGRDWVDIADGLHVRGKHSLEGACVREADALTTVSETTAEEIAAFHGRRPDVLLPNGIDLDALAAAAPGTTPDIARGALRRLASRLTGDDLSSARIVVSAGRREFRNKGFDLVLDAAAATARSDGPKVVFFLFVPAANSGLVRAVAERLRGDGPADGPVGIATHQVHDAAADPILARCAELGLVNAPESRVKVVYVPAYLHGDDGAVDLPYEAALRGADVTVFPSFYDAWGLTPQESLALGVPTITSDRAGFGRWVEAEALTAEDGVRVLARRGRSFDESRDALVVAIDDALGTGASSALSERCRLAAGRTSWTRLIVNYEAAFACAADVAAARPAAPQTRATPAAAPSAPRAEGPSVFPIDAANETPAALAPLERLARNWRFTWDPEVAALFRILSPEAHEAFRGDPLRVLRGAPPEALAAAARDPQYVALVERIAARTDAALAGPAETSGALSPARPVAYVCAEFGLHECLPIYSGGLGVLAGDHLRAASDLALPLVAVGLLYRKGYMRQRLVGGVEQEALPDDLDPRATALTPVLDDAGAPVVVKLNLPGVTLRLAAWRADVGRVALYLLDSDVEGNRAEDRVLTHSLYGGDAETRVRQEIVLGRGAVRLLDKLGIEPSVWHVNEGHGAFTAVERAERLVRDARLTFDEAREFVRATTAFTTHTPVPAGHDVFDEDVMRRHFSHSPERLGVAWDRFFALGAGDGPGFNMTRLAMRFASFVNGVSVRHGEVSRRLLRSACPHLAPEELPIASVTNGVHLAAWTAVEMAGALGVSGRCVVGADFANAARTDVDPLWAARGVLKRALIDRLRAHVVRTADVGAARDRTLAGLSSEALYIGFARRFATYKRADLLLSDSGKLRALLSDPDRPVRLLVAGKAHPKDRAAQELLAKVARAARSDEFAGRLIVLEDYDMGLARTLVQGVDVWLNLPRPPFEASGTSGMKAAANGALNVSIGDGWWLEAFDGVNGWMIGGRGPFAADDRVQDEADAWTLARTLEDEVVPLFFDRDERGVPLRWMERVRRSLATIPAVFDTGRMVAEYRDRAYAPLAARAAELSDDGYAGARALASRRARLAAEIAAARIVRVEMGHSATVGRGMPARVDVDLGALSPQDICVEIAVGRRVGAELADVVVVPLAPDPSTSIDPRRFVGTFTPRSPGSFGFVARVRPRGPATLHEPAVWA